MRTTVLTLRTTVLAAAVLACTALVPQALAPDRAAAAPDRSAGVTLGTCEPGRLCLWKKADFTGARHTFELSGTDIESCVPLPGGGDAQSLANRTGLARHHLPVRRVRGDRGVRDLPRRRDLDAPVPVPGARLQDLGELSPDMPEGRWHRATAPPGPSACGYASPPAAPGSAAVTSSSS